MTDLATPFRTILKGLLAVIGIVARKEPHRDAFLARIYFHLNRTIQRFEKLVTHWRNSTLPRQRQRAPRPARTRSNPRLPTGRAWLIRNVDHYNFRGHASQLQHFLATPECVAFLTEVPRAASILRPLAKSLGIQMPGDPPPPNPKPAKSPFLPRPLAGSGSEPDRGWGDAARKDDGLGGTRLTPNHPIFSKAR